MKPFLEKLFKKDKTKDSSSAGSGSRGGRSLPCSGNDGRDNGRESGSKPIAFGRHPYGDHPYGAEADISDLQLDIPAALRPQASRDDFDPYGILGKGSFATVVLVRAKPTLQAHTSKPGSLASRVGGLLSSSPKQTSKLGGSSSSPTAPQKRGSVAGQPTKGSSGSIGSGFGANKDLFAMKIIAKKRLLDSKRMRDVFTERDVLTKASHPYLLKLHYTFQSENKLFFVMDYMPGGDIRALINGFRRRREPMPYEMARLLAAEVTLALTHLHDHGILYRDLKPENILLSEEGHCALADFGLSKDFGDLWIDEDEEVMRLKEKVPSMRASSFVGSPLYVAPEVLLREKYTKPIDFWGLGILIFTLLFGAEPFRGSNAKEIFDKILSNAVRFPTSMTTTPEAMDIIVRLLDKDPQQRLGAPEIFAHPFFRGIDWAALMRQELTPPGWVPPPPLAIVNSAANGGGMTLIAGDSSRNLAAPTPGTSHHHFGGVGSHQLPPSERGLSEVYTPEHHTGQQLRVSQQCFFENFSWANVEHMQTLAGGESQIVLSDGTIIHSSRDFASGRGDAHFASERSHSDSQQSEFYDASEPSELQRSFGDIHSGAAYSASTGTSLRFSGRATGGSGSNPNVNANNNAIGPSPPVSFRELRAAAQQLQPHTVVSAHRPQAVHGGHRPTHGSATSSPTAAHPSLAAAKGQSPTRGALHQPVYAHPDMAAGHAAAAPHQNRGSSSSNNAVRVGAAAGMGSKQESTSSFFMPPPSEGFDSNLSL